MGTLWKPSLFYMPGTGDAQHTQHLDRTLTATPGSWSFTLPPNTRPGPLGGAAERPRRRTCLGNIQPYVLEVFQRLAFHLPAGCELQRAGHLPPTSARSTQQGLASCAWCSKLAWGAGRAPVWTTGYEAETPLQKALGIPELCCLTSSPTPYSSESSQLKHGKSPSAMKSCLPGMSPVELLLFFLPQEIKAIVSTLGLDLSDLKQIAYATWWLCLGTARSEPGVCTGVSSNDENAIRGPVGLETRLFRGKGKTREGAEAGLPGPPRPGQGPGLALSPPVPGAASPGDGQQGPALLLMQVFTRGQIQAT